MRTPWVTPASPHAGRVLFNTIMQPQFTRHVGRKRSLTAGAVKGLRTRCRWLGCPACRPGCAIRQSRTSSHRLSPWGAILQHHSSPCPLSGLHLIPEPWEHLWNQVFLETVTVGVSSVNWDKKLVAWDLSTLWVSLSSDSAEEQQKISPATKALGISS